MDGWQSERMRQTANLLGETHTVGLNPTPSSKSFNGSEHGYAAGFYKSGRVVRWAATIEFESLRYYQLINKLCANILLRVKFKQVFYTGA